MDNKIISVLNHMNEHCNRIEQTKAKYGNSLNQFIQSLDCQDIICMHILQIGELTTHLSNEFKNSNLINWNGYKYIRNICAHRYGTVDLDIIWRTVNTDIPILKDFCEQQINQYNLLNQDAIEPDYDDEDEFEI